MGRIIGFLIKIVLVLILPFILLIRGSVYFHENENWYPYVSLIVGIGVASVVLLIYFLVFYGIVLKKTSSLNVLKKTAMACLIIVGSYCIHGLFFISTKNVKSSALKSEIRDLHPILRIALSTIILIDKDLIITDASRIPEDYRKMGLPTKSSSLHYRQKDGFAYAVDLRTSERMEIRNWFIRSYFWAMGFKTLRHGGTGDHLHISLYCPFRPGSI